MMTCRMGFCRAFEEMGIPYLIVDVRDLVRVLPTVPNPFVCIFGSDFDVIDRRTVRLLKRHPLFVWVNPWFKGSDAFFAQHNLDPTIWTWTDQHLRKILDSEPGFVYTATVSKGLGFFEEWGNRGLKVVSLPLACDATLYSPSAPMRPEFEGVRMAFVGGYWESKGRQIDKYLRPFEAELTIYGYSPWPYRGYRGMLPRDAEPSLYRQARLSPTINEPTVRLLHGQINERVFKVLGCGGATVVDAVPAYRELFTEEELPIPQDEREFVEMARELLRDPVLREEQAQRGLRAVTNRHTYEDRARVVLDRLGLGKPAERASDKKDDSVHRHA
ncbi:glycosyltransferase family 1 protein [Candidatus Sumerlaeota bacterium]|nr:glycosyltransferase family 1 protein [Candidatus Sumerlaeota bacterium]